MNTFRLGSNMAGSPSSTNDERAVRFSSRARRSSAIPCHPMRDALAPRHAFNSILEQVRIQFGRKHRNARGKAVGRLEQIISKDSSKRQYVRRRRKRHRSLEAILNEPESFPRRRR